MTLAPKFGIFTLAVLLFAAPTVACIVPTTVLTEAERDCCRHMADQCGGVQMPASHSCCQRLAVADDTGYIVTRSQLASSDLVTLGIDLLPVALHNPISIVAARVSNDAIHGPPESPPVSTSVLRI